MCVYSGMHEVYRGSCNNSIIAVTPTTSQAATHKVEVVVLGVENVKWCIGSKTEMGSRIVIAFFKYESISECIESKYDKFCATPEEMVSVL